MTQSRPIRSGRAAEILAEHVANQLTGRTQVDYEETQKMIRELPATWIPALLKELVVTGYKKRVFQPFGASRLINSLENSDEMRGDAFKYPITCRGCGKVFEGAEALKIKHCDNCGVEL